MITIKQPASLELLIKALQALPGIGPKSAQRIAYHLMQEDRGCAIQLGEALLRASKSLDHCARCNAFTELKICAICSDETRDSSVLCVVENPADQAILEQTMMFNGLYFILMGHLSPLDGIGPSHLHFDRLMNRIEDGEVKEVVLATNFTNEGEATAHYLGQILKTRGLSVSRLARGVPMGGELEYVDIGTIARAVIDRRSL